MNTEFHLILPDIRSCHNVGAMFRTADAFGVTKLWLVGYTAAPPKPQIDKVSLGAEKWIPFEQIQKQDYSSLLTTLQSQGFEIIALEKNNASTDIRTTSFSSKVALIVGNEVDGVREESLNACNKVVHIPMMGKKESLNVSIAAGIAMYEVRKRLDEIAV